MLTVDYTPAIHELRYGSVTEAKQLLARQIAVLANVRRGLRGDKLGQEFCNFNANPISHHIVLTV